jgi:pseudoazurin
MTRTFGCAVATISLLTFASSAMAADYTVKMLNKDSDNHIMTFEPAFLKILPGDTVHFVPTDKGHDAGLIDGMLPAGAQPFKGKLSQEFSVTFQVPGVYGYRCTPHFGMGMVGLIEVGNSTANLNTARQVKLPPLATKRMAALFDQAAQSVAADPAAGRPSH